MKVNKQVSPSDWVEPDDAPELTGEELERRDATWRIGDRKLAANEGKAAFKEALGVGKQRLTIMLDRDVLAHFKARAGARGYQTLINETLRAAMSLEHTETILRRVIREELDNPGRKAH